MFKRLRHWLVYPESPLKLTLVLSIPLIAIILGLSVLIIHWQKKTLDEIELSNMKLYGQAFLEHILRSDIWQTRHNGFFVEKSQHLQPATPGINIMGKTFVRVDPSLYTRTIETITRTRSVYRFHITSIESIGTKNSPDRWELDALTRFSQGVSKEEATIVNFGGGSYFRYMRPIELGESCRQCHRSLHGGLSVEIPVDYAYRLYAAQIKRSSITFATFGLFIIAFVMVVTYYLSGRISKGFKTVQALNEQLRELSARNERLLESVVDGILVLSPEGRVVMVNESFRELTGIEVIHGSSIDEISDSDPLKRIIDAGDHEEIELHDRNLLVRRLTVEDRGTTFGTMFILHDATKEYLTAAMELAGSTAHELRQPLSILLNLMGILQDKVHSGEDPSEVIQYMQEQCERMNRIIEKMLKISRYQRKRYTEDTRILDIEASSE